MITTEAEYEQVRAITDAISRSARFRELHNRSIGYGAELNESEEAEWQTMLADFSEKCDAQAAFKQATMDRICGQLA